MRVRVLTLFPQMFNSLRQSIIGRAIDGGIIDFDAVDIRAYSLDRHNKCDDVPYGGGAGMVMTPQPIADSISAVDPLRKAKRIYLSPKGKLLDSELSIRLSKESDIVLLCGHYEGVDQRVIDLYIDEEVSIGDYVLTGGELAAMVLIDCISRYIPGVLGSNESANEESFSKKLLEYPHYTRPQVFEGLTVPEVLLSGHHKKIEQWRNKKSFELTKKLRPDLLSDILMED